MNLTVGLSTFDDYEGVYFTIQHLRMMPSPFDLQFVVVDQNPTSEYGTLTKRFVENQAKGVYIPYTERLGPSHGREQAIKAAKTDWILLLDSHVLLSLSALKYLHRTITTGKHDNCLIQGPLVYDDMIGLSSHWRPRWSGQSFGTWDMDERARDEQGEPFDIPMTGVGIMAFHKAHWPGYNPDFEGFGAEEWYIHRKYRKRGGRTLCLPGLRWVHRFGRMPHIKYPLCVENKIVNTLIGDIELGDWKQYFEDVQHFTTHFPGPTQIALELVRAKGYATP